MLRGTLWASIEPVWQAAIAEAWAAYAAGSHAIGAVVTAPGGTIVARGRNRTRDAEPTTGQLHGSRLAHAEMNALYALPKDADPLSLTLWTTHEPCPLCAGAVLVSKVRRLRFASRELLAGSLEILTVNRFARSRPVEVSGPDRADVERVLVALELEFALREGWASELYLGVLRGPFPGAVATAERAHATGWLWELARSGASVEEAVDTVASDRLIAPGV